MGFGSNSEWYFKYLAGLRQTTDSRGWQQLDLHPQVWNEQRKTSICANLSSTEGSIVTPRGLLSGSWTCGGGPSGLCGQAAEHQSLKLTCDGSGTIAKIDAAFFGTPSGSCAGGFEAGSCNAAGVMQKIATKCVGRPECTI